MRISIYEDDSARRARKGSDNVFIGFIDEDYGKNFEVTTQSVMRWIRKMYDKFIMGKLDISAIREVEMDEMHHYHKKTQKLWIWKIIDHRSKDIFGRTFGHRDTRILAQRYDGIKFEKMPYMYASNHGCYRNFFFEEKSDLYVSCFSF